jgi:hypothetical protein
MFCIDSNRAPASTCPEEIAYVARHLQGYSKGLSALRKGTYRATQGYYVHYSRVLCALLKGTKYTTQGH